MTVSILLPTRKRVPLLKKCVESLLDNAADPTKIQLLFGVDDDDPETIVYLKDFKHPAGS